MPFDLGAVEPDIVVAACYKWLLGPYSTGFMYVAPRWHEGRPLEHNWIAREGSENFGGLVRYRDEYQPGARRYDVGEPSNFALMPAAVAALEQILAWTPVPNLGNTCRRHSRDHAARVTPRLHLGRRFDPGATLSRAPSGRGTARRDWENDSRRNRSLCRPAAPRSVSLPHLYNDSADLDRFEAALSSCLTRPVTP
jgi:selenocysteine lyase/cysteine desulfurase